MNKQSFIKILLTVLMSMTGAKAFAYDIFAKNDDGVTIYYVWTNNKTELAVSYDGYYRNSRSYSGNVVIPEFVKYGDETYKVTSINESAFYGCGGLTSVTIPNSVKYIGYQSFYDCGGLTTVNFPNSLIGIGENAFMGTAWYNNQPNGLIYAGKLAYIYKGEMPANTHITLGNGTLAINYNAFSGCSGLTSVTIPNSVTSIGVSAFSGCNGLTSVTIPNSVKSIGNYAFLGCSSLTSATIPNSVTSIGDYAFNNCSGLTSVTIPNSVTSIGIYAFYGCSGLTTIVSEIKSPFEIGAIGETSITLIVPVGTKTDYQSTAGWSSFTKTVEVGEGGVVGTKFEIDGIYYTIDENNTASSASSKKNISGAIVIPSQVEFNGKKYDVTSIGESAFYGCSGLTSVTIPNSVTSIGNYAFGGCSGLTSVIIPNSVTSIGDCAFYECNGLTSVILNSSLTTIGNIPFYGCNNIEEVSFDCEAVPSLFSNFSGIKKVTLSENVKTISKNAFSNCSGLTSVTIPNSVTSIGESAFSSCRGLTSVTIPSSVTSIDKFAFSGCSGLTSVTIPNNVTSIGYYAFSSCSGLTSVTIPSSVTSIGEGAFYSCSGLTSVTIPNSVTSIGYRAFYSCSGLTSVIIGSGVLSIGSEAFRYTNLKKTIWLTNTPPSGYSYASGAVNYVSNDQFNISNKVVYKSLSSYFDVDGIRYVPVSPSERTCDAIDCVYNETAANIAINSTVAYKGVTMNVKNINQYLAYDNKHIKTLGVDIDGEVSNYAFTNCSNIQSITLGKKVSAIGSYAFQGCSSFETINIPDIVTVLNEGTFSGCTSLKEIIIKPQMTNINNSVFENCTSLKKVIIDDSESTLTLGSNGSNPIFSSCPLNYVYIGRDISYQTSSSYGYSPFYRNTTLRAVKITDKETEISDNEFYGCTKLQQVEIGDGVTTIGKWAFSGCQSLKYFAFGSQVENIGQEAFSDCTALVQITSRAKKAPACGSQALEDINKWECKLYVPQGYLSVYQAAEQWKDFWFMEEGEGTPPKELIIGDVNSDGLVDQDDLRDLVEYIMGNKPNGVTEDSADVNGDNKVNIADVVALTSLLK